MSDTKPGAGGDRAMVRNAADRDQVKFAKRKEERAALERDVRMRRVLALPEGRAFCWDLLERAGVFRSCFSTHGAIQSYNLGKQDYGHELMADLVRVDETLYMQMEAEARARGRRDASEIDAAHTPPSEQGATS